jgi:hypothetical protein
VNSAVDGQLFKKTAPAKVDRISFLTIFNEIPRYLMHGE